MLNSLAKLKQHIFSAEHFSAWASDNAPTLLSSGTNGRRATMNRMALIPQNGWINDSSRRLSAIFSTSFGPDSTNNNSDLCLFTMNAEGILTEYHILIRRERHNSTSSGNAININGSASSINNANALSESVLSTSPSSITSFIGSSNGIANNKVSNSYLDAPIRIKVTSSTQWILRRYFLFKNMSN